MRLGFKELVAQIYAKKSFLCVGLDVDLDKIPKHLLKLDNPIIAFNKAIIEATQDLAVAYKPNTAFFECYGTMGWEALAETAQMIPNNCLKIADAKRGDIGNTSERYAKAFFEDLKYNALTIAPYMGKDSVQPFHSPDAWSIVLALTSNAGADDFQKLNIDGQPLYKHVLQKVSSWGSKEQTMFVVGATQGELFNEVRSIVPEHFLLVPGVGAQGGSLQEVYKYGAHPENVSLLVNSSRGIIYASSGEDFADAARKEALKLQQEMNILMGG
jgi:orotidine-5'-phosphate decarboxylase